MIEGRQDWDLAVDVEVEDMAVAVAVAAAEEHRHDDVSVDGEVGSPLPTNKEQGEGFKPLEWIRVLEAFSKLFFQGLVFCVIVLVYVSRLTKTLMD